MIQGLSTETKDLLRSESHASQNRLEIMWTMESAARNGMSNNWLVEENRVTQPEFYVSHLHRCYMVIDFLQ